MRPILFGYLIVSLFAGNADARPKKKQTTRNRTIETVFDLSAVNSTQWTGGQGAALLRTQILLDRAHFSPGEIDGHPGPNLERAIRGWQRARNTPVDGTLSEAVWQALNADTAPAVVPYRISEQDVAGPFVDIPADLVEQSKLPGMGYSSPEEALGEMFHASPALLKKMNPGAAFKPGDEILVPNVLTQAAGKATRVVVTKSGTLTAFDAAGKVLAQYPCSSGSEHDPLPIGEWKVTGVYKDPVFHYNPELFWDADPTHSKAKIQPGPNNPVGVVWIDLSKEHYGIHGTPMPGKVGHTQSHGCIRLTNWDARELAGLLAKGVPAILTEDEE
jgi:lipoprotein-anchoring transpeptidase ErfK/SrfK